MDIEPAEVGLSGLGPPRTTTVFSPGPELLAETPAGIALPVNSDQSAPPDREMPIESIPSESQMVFVPDGVLRGVMIVLVFSVFQRLIGFVRAVWFCRRMELEALGQWEILFSFFNLAAPFVTLSLPGVFGRYVERYRQQRHLRSFVRESAWACAGLTAVAGLVLWWTRPWLGPLLFGGPGSDELLALLPCTLASIIALNYMTELFTALRSVRVASILFFLNSVVFAGLGVALLDFWRSDAVSVVAAYGAANLVGAVAAVRILRRNFSALPPEPTPFDRAEFWRRILPFALGVWTINLVTNLFSVVDRYLIVHWAPGDARTALSLVGQYHSSRLLPLLLLSIVQMLGAMILPYLTADWEASRKDQAGLRLRVALKLLSFGMTALSVLAILASPLLFSTALGGKFRAGEEILPGTLIYCIWFGLALVAQNYLWCAEKAWWATAALASGLVANVVLNSFLLPRWGLPGVILGTSLSHLLVLGLMVGWSCRVGFQADWALVGMLLLPASLSLGPFWAGGALALVGLTALASHTFLTPQEKELLRTGFAGQPFPFPWLSSRSSPPRTPEDLP